ncbi:6-pyruvoyl trahydropterin synthase family protein [Halovivax gelatinilyticus]|uniref:6-pyruvoyl trahydropterin synthase family protein n=1 Tax=Halovivax gelatinilyticus TaxID=2961597 RepID=UPI0020CA85C0|nr:6-carboxytetrahydropterin synthase [Halovivax gelatinilyticus]
MYEVSVSRSFVAQHALTVVDAGPEGSVHSHRYTVEVTVFGPSIDERGYLVDIDELSAVVDELVARYRDRTLNDLESFEGRNPSAERFARIFGDRLCAALEPAGATRLRVSMAEDEIARVAHERSLEDGSG